MSEVTRGRVQQRSWSVPAFGTPRGHVAKYR